MDFISTEIIFSALGLLLVFGYWIFNFVVVYHLVRFGVGVQPKDFAIIFLLGSVLLFSLSVSLFAELDFSSLGSSIKEASNNLTNFTRPQL